MLALSHLHQLEQPEGDILQATRACCSLDSCPYTPDWLQGQTTGPPLPYEQQGRDAQGGQRPQDGTDALARQGNAEISPVQVGQAAADKPVGVCLWSLHNLLN